MNGLAMFSFVFGVRIHRPVFQEIFIILCEKGINAFMDDQGVRKEEEITPTLMKAIQESKIAIVIFSENYASSTFCLQELVKIMECFKHNGKLVWPVFYKVDQVDVDHQKGSYVEALVKHETRISEKDKLKKMEVSFARSFKSIWLAFQQRTLRSATSCSQPRTCTLAFTLATPCAYSHSQPHFLSQVRLSQVLFCIIVRETIEARDLVRYGSADEGFEIVGILVQSFLVRVELEVVICFFELIEGFVYGFESIVECGCLAFR
ncbi:TMV resistance protein N [Glycine soja]|uniref:TMV resistance protein N n=1 Tax=Glycine soja TaxID=3848 RepID=A0A0B2P0X8_GLYSO|nr:TMV resistance protein N [Glycine soja]KHN23527.1 TMV resistance protein N [Glycine soja]